MFQLFTCPNGVRLVQESRLTQTSPQVDVDEAPGAELLYTTELVAFHDPIKLLNSDDHLELCKEPLPISTLGQLLDSEGGVARVERSLLSRSPASPRVDLKSMFFSARSETSLNCGEVDLSALLDFKDSRHSPDS